MNTECISNIDLKTNNKETISVLNDRFSNFYVSNIDNNGDEVNYEPVKHSNSLYANFFMIKLKKSNNLASINAINRILSQRDIIKIGVEFNNGYYQEFDLAKKRIANNGKLENIYEDTFMDDEDNLCIIVCDKNIKYKKELFV